MINLLLEKANGANNDSPIKDVGTLGEEGVSNDANNSEEKRGQVHRHWRQGALPPKMHLSCICSVVFVHFSIDSCQIY